MTHIIDIDGTLVNYHANTWLPGALGFLKEEFENGACIILITMRGEQDHGTEWSIERTKETLLKELDEMGINYRVHFGVPSPRILHDDNHIMLNRRETNQHWITYAEIRNL